jgi:hypothetical protein
MSVSLEYITKIIAITGKNELSHLPLIWLIYFKKVMDEIEMNEVKIPKPPTLKESCTGFSCVCWKYNRKACTTYNICLKCRNILSFCKC